jgi:hypothetical protein
MPSYMVLCRGAGSRLIPWLTPGVVSDQRRVRLSRCAKCVSLTLFA